MEPSTWMNIEETYGRLTRRIGELVGAEKCAICLYDPVSREMIGQAPGYGVSDATRCLRAWRGWVGRGQRLALSPWG